MSITLRDSLLAALARLPGTRQFHLHVLVSAPRKHAGLFPYASPRPRTYLQDVLVLLSEQATPDSPRILVTAVEACVYNMVSTSSAIFYVSKVDSTGQAASPSPTPTIVRSLLLFYADPATRPIAVDHFWIQLFARAQAQYLFPNSGEYEGKKPLSDVKLCGWWKRIFGEVAAEVQRRLQPGAKTRLYYVLPGCAELEATHMLKSALDSASTPSWTYGHPYSQLEIPLPCPPDTSEGARNLGHYIPWFDDDPKSRFIDEIAYTTNGEIKTPVRKRTRTHSRAEGSHSNVQENEGTEGKEIKTAKDKDDHHLGELRKVTADEFWERMSFRQECIAGAVTGFFSVVVSSPDSSRNLTRSEVSPLAPQPGQVSSQMNKRVLTSLTTGVEFSTIERSMRATEIVEGAIKKLCDGIAPLPTGHSNPTRSRPKSQDNNDSGSRTPEREASAHPTLLAPPSTPPPRLVSGKRVAPEVSPNPFPEPVTSLETYGSFIYGSVQVSNPVVGPKTTTGSGVVKEGGGGEATAPHVTVLTVRKKKRRTE